MTTRLRLHRGDTEDPAAVGRRTGRIGSAEMRARLVAGRVEGDPLAEDHAGGLPRLTLHTDEGERPIGNEALIAQIERTMDRIQARLDEVRREVDRPFKFPERDDGGWPPRAA